MGNASAVIPAATTVSSVACHRSLGRRGVRTIAVSVDGDVPSFRSRYCDETVTATGPREDLVGYKETLLELAARPDVETVVPLGEDDVYVLSRYRSEFAEHVATPWPSFETLRTVHDRERLFEVARDAGVPVPETTPLDEVDDWGPEQVVKPRFALLAGEYLPDGSETGIVDGASPTFLGPGERPDAERMRSVFHHSPDVQRFVDGTEYSMCVLYDDGEPVVEAGKRKVRGMKYYRGPSVHHESVDDPELEDLGRRLLGELDWHGPADIDVIRDEETGEYMLLEINPRFWSNVQLDVHAGVDFPYYYWRMARDDPARPTPEPEYGTASNFLPGELSYLLSVLTDDHPLCDPPSGPAAAREVVRSVVASRRFDLLDLDDPAPFVSFVADTVRG